MDVCHLLLDDKTDEVVELGDDDGAEDKHSDGMEPIAYQGHVDGNGYPDEGGAYHGDDTGDSGEETG